MTNGNLDFVLGQIDAKLELNEATHKEIKGLLTNLDRKLDTFGESTNKTIATLCEDIGGLKGKASIWGGFIGFIVSAVMGVAGWFVLHLQGK